MFSYRTADCRVSGIQTSDSESVQMPTNPGGPTPMTVTGRLLTVMVWPTAASELPNDRFQNPSLMTATASS